MVIYSIKEIEKLSGVKAHTLRIWEKRYGIVVPNRTDTNIRYYTDDQLKRILNVSFLNRNNIKISKIAKLSEEEIKRKVSELSEVDKVFEDQLDSLVLSLLELDDYNFNKILNQHIEQIGFEKTMMEIVYPLLDKLSVMWVAGSLKSVHERFVTNVIKSKIILATEKLKYIRNDIEDRILIYLPEGEDHELSLLYLKFLLKKFKFFVVNLGANISLQEVIEASQLCKPNYIFTIINDSIKDAALNEYISDLQEYIGETTLLLSGRQVVLQGIKSNESCRVFKNLQETISFLEEKNKTNETN